MELNNSELQKMDLNLELWNTCIKDTKDLANLDEMEEEKAVIFMYLMLSSRESETK
jgi:hypothetical protein